jgi:4-azaleucine resistance transporter AzlC
MDGSWSDFVAGARDIALVVPGPFSVSVIATVAAMGAGLTALQAYVMIGLTFAGASQLAALELMASEAAVVVIVVTALIINARFAIFSASLAPHFSDFSSRWRWLLGVVLSTPASVLSLTRFGDDEPVDARSYYLGAALTLWATWQIGSLLGIALGTRVPDLPGVDFVVPLVFIGLLFSTIDDRSTTVAAVVGGVIAVAGIGLPLDLGFLVGTGVGLLAGQAATWSGLDDRKRADPETDTGGGDRD